MVQKRYGMPVANELRKKQADMTKLPPSATGRHPTRLMIGDSAGPKCELKYIYFKYCTKYTKPTEACLPMSIAGAATAYESRDIYLHLDFLCS